MTVRTILVRKNCVFDQLSNVSFSTDMIVTPEEIDKALDKLKSGKSPGHDNICGEHF